MSKPEIQIEDNRTLQDIFSRLRASVSDQNPKSFREQFHPAIKTISRRFGIQAALNMVKRLEVAAAFRRPTLAIYDHCIHFIGGGQKYGMTMALALQESFDVTILANKPVTLDIINNWYDLDLDRCAIKIIPIPFYENLGTTHLDPVRVNRESGNPFDLISLESSKYDFFINNSMLEMVYPLSNVSVMMVHFPERRPSRYFYSRDYTAIMYNSRYTASWIEKKWKFPPHKHIFPPVDMRVYDGTTPKKNIILSVARFEEGGTKKQVDMIKNFSRLLHTFPRAASGWKLILAGGSNRDNPYLSLVREQIRQFHDDQIELKVNISADELKKLYREASIFWHLCGLGQNDPAKVEHFGMTICEAMQNSLVPIVFDGGGQKEIVDHGRTGFRVQSGSQLIQYTRELLENQEKLKRLGESASQASKKFEKDRFIKEIQEFFEDLQRQFVSAEPDHDA